MVPVRLLLSLCFCGILLCCFTATSTYAQAAKTPGWVVAAYNSSAPGNVFYNTDTVHLTLTLKATGNTPLTLKGGSWRIKEIEDIWPWPWQGQKERLRIGAMCAEGAITPVTGNSIPVSITWKPTRLGAFGVFLQPDDGTGTNEQMAWGFLVVYPPSPGHKANSPIVFNLQGEYIPNYGAAYQRLGAKWVRWEVGWSTNEPHPGQWTWDSTDSGVDAARKHDLYVVAIMAHAPDWATPHLGRKFVTYADGNKPETNVDPQHLPQWQEWARRFVERYQDTIRAGIMLNEPWEGGSISGWHGNGAHYRNMLRAFFGGVHAADRTFTVLANDSGMNAEDNLLCDTGAIQYTDAVSIHTFRSYLGYYRPQFAAYGKPVWDTESWNGVGEAENVYQCVLGLSQGMVKMQPCSTEDIIMNLNKDNTFLSPTGQALSTLLHFVEDTTPAGEPRPNTEPWMVVFRDDKEHAAKNAAVIWGRDRKWGNDPFSQVTRDGALTLTDAKNTLTAYDIHGNPLPRVGKNVVVPLTTTPYYLVSSKGADDLTQRLKTATISGLEPVQITMTDFTQPLAQTPPLRVTLTNIQNVPLSGAVTVSTPAGWEMETHAAFTALAPGASTELTFAVKNAKPVAGNRYPFSAHVVTDYGENTLTEELSVDVFAKGTPALEGSTAADWQKLGAVPVYMSAKPTPVDSFAQYAFPFLDLKAQDNKGYFAQFMGMWDENNFYVFADINDSTRVLRPSLQKSDWYAMHAAPLDWEYWMDGTFPGTGGDMVDIGFNVLPYGEKLIANFQPEAQKQVPAKWRIDPADYELSLYLAKQEKIPDGEYQRAYDAYQKIPGDWGTFPEPKLAEVAPPIPEVWRSMAPGVPRTNYFPFSPRAVKDQGVVPGAKLTITREGDVWHYRAAIPWSELALVKPLALDGKPVKFTFACKNDGNRTLDWNRGRSVSRLSQELLHPTWEEAWAPETAWGFIGGGQ